MENKFKDARKLMWDTIENDPDLKRHYIAQIGLFLFINFSSKDSKLNDGKYKDQAAAKLLHILLASSYPNE